MQWFSTRSVSIFNTRFFIICLVYKLFINCSSSSTITRSRSANLNSKRVTIYFPFALKQFETNEHGRTDHTIKIIKSLDNRFTHWFARQLLSSLVQ